MPPKAERKPRSFMKTCHSSGAAMRSAQRCRDAQRLAGAQLTCGIASAFQHFRRRGSCVERGLEISHFIFMLCWLTSQETTFHLKYELF